MSGGRPCALCSLPIIDDVVAWRLDSVPIKTIHQRIHTAGFTKITRANIDYCLRNAEHHGPMPPMVPNSIKPDETVGIAKLLKDAGIDPQLAATAKRITIRGPKEWQGFFKTPDGDAEVVQLGAKQAVTLQLTPEWQGPAWQPVQPARPVTVRVPALSKPKTSLKTAVILPDIQFGYRRYDDGSQVPFHDDRALNVALEVIRITKPDTIVLLGDNLDLPEHSRFDQEASFARTTQLALDDCHQFLATLRAYLPDAQIVWLEGNHELRLARHTLANAKAAYGLKQANSAPPGWPVLSVPHLLRLDELNVTYAAGFPANIFWLNDRLACIHGEKVRSNGSTAAAVIDDERVSIIFGHIHRIELQHKTRRVRDGARTVLAASPGCLCRIDGAVPSVKSGIDVFGRPLSRPENWQQGLAIATYADGDGPFGLELVPIHDGIAFLRGEPIIAS